MLFATGWPRPLGRALQLLGAAALEAWRDVWTFWLMISSVETGGTAGSTCMHCAVLHTNWGRHGNHVGQTA